MTNFLKKYATRLLSLVLMVGVVGGWSNLVGIKWSDNLVFGYGFGGGGGGGGGSPTPPLNVLLETGGPGTGSNNTGSSNTGLNNQDNDTPNTPRGDAYRFAKENQISTMPSYAKARLESGITRGEAAKVVVQFYKNVLKKSISRSNVCNPSNFKDFSSMDTETKGFVRDACSIGVMGWKNDKSGTIEYFRPYSGVTRGEIATILSRMIFNTASTDTSENRYENHLNVLENNNILPNKKSPNANELRGDVFQMLENASK